MSLAGQEQRGNPSSARCARVQHTRPVWKARTAPGRGRVCLRRLTGPDGSHGGGERVRNSCGENTQASAPAIYPAKVLRDSRRWYLRANGAFAFHNHFRKGCLLIAGDRRGLPLLTRRTTILAAAAIARAMESTSELLQITC